MPIESDLSPYSRSPSLPFYPFCFPLPPPHLLSNSNILSEAPGKGGGSWKGGGPWKGEASWNHTQKF